MCVWSLGSNGNTRQKRSFRVKPAPWNQTFEGKAEVAVFFDLFTAKLNQALLAFKQTGRIPDVYWHCSVLDRKSGKHRRKLRPTIPQGQGSLDDLWSLVKNGKAARKHSPKDDYLGRRRDDYFGFLSDRFCLLNAFPSFPSFAENIVILGEDIVSSGWKIPSLPAVNSDNQH